MTVVLLNTTITNPSVAALPLDLVPSPANGGVRFLIDLAAPVD